MSTEPSFHFRIRDTREPPGAVRIADEFPQRLNQMRVWARLFRDATPLQRRGEPAGQTEKAERRTNGQ